MKTSLIITFIGADRPGLVNLLAERATAAGANWLESSMSNLAGKFAGVVRLEVAAGDLEKLEASLRALESDGLRVTIERGNATSDVPFSAIKLELVGHDRPGIVRDISAALARQGASISKIETVCENASFSGEPLFRASIDVQVPLTVQASALQSELEALANELMVDLRTTA